MVSSPLAGSSFSMWRWTAPHWRMMPPLTVRTASWTAFLLMCTIQNAMNTISILRNDAPIMRN